LAPPVSSTGSFSPTAQTTLLELPGARSTRATAINNRGDFVGFYNNSDGGFHGFVYSGGEFTTVDFPGSSDSGAFGISNQGVMVGTYNDFSFGFVATPLHGSEHEATEISCRTLTRVR
jgi:probable HAF family extracellular repeat protein